MGRAWEQGYLQGTIEGIDTSIHIIGCETSYHYFSDHKQFRFNIDSMPIVLRLTVACNHIYLLFLSVVLPDEESQSALQSLQNVLPGYRHLPSYNPYQKGPISVHAFF